MFDSSGHLSAGILDGNVFQLGSAYMCLDIAEEEPYIREEDQTLSPLRWENLL